MFRTEFKTGPVELFAEDMFELENILKENFPQHTNFEILTRYKEREYENTSMKHFLEADLPNTNDRLSISARGWNENNEIVKTVTINLYNSFGSIGISCGEETWFRVMKEILEEFFKKRKPSYNRLRNFIVIAGFGTPVIITTSVFLNLLLNEAWIGFPLLIIFILGSIVCLILSNLVMVQQKFLPFIKINYFPRSERKRINIKGVSYFIFSVIVGIATIIGAVYAIKSYYE